MKEACPYFSSLYQSLITAYWRTSKDSNTLNLYFKVDLTPLVTLCLIAQWGCGIPGTGSVPFSLLLQVRAVARSPCFSLLLKAKLIFVTLRIVIARLNFLGRLCVGDFFNMWVNSNSWCPMCLRCVEVNLFVAVLVWEGRSNHMGKMLMDLPTELDGNLGRRLCTFSVLLSWHGDSHNCQQFVR